MLNRVYIALGSNIGDRTGYLNQGLKRLGEVDDVEVVQVSSFLNTKAVAIVSQPDYLNAVAEIRTLLGVDAFFKLTQDVEKDFGRKSKGSGDPRTLDIDVLFFNNDIVSSDELTIPHPLLHERGFVLGPLCEIVPDFVHPILNLTVKQLYDQVHEHNR